jgi:hypothetical protein
MMDAFRWPIPSPCPGLPWVIVIRHIQHGEQERLLHKDTKQTAKHSTKRKPKQVAPIQHRPKETILPDMQRLVLNGSAKDGLRITHCSRDEVPRSNARQQSTGLGDAAKSEATLVDQTILPLTVLSLIPSCPRKRTEQQEKDCESRSDDGPGGVSKEGKPSHWATPVIDLSLSTDDPVTPAHKSSNKTYHEPDDISSQRRKKTVGAKAASGTAW